MPLFHVGALSLETDSKRLTHWQGLTPQTRILCVAILVVAIVITPNGHWLTWGIYSIGVLGTLLISQISFVTLLKRLAVELSFVSVVLLGALFRGGGDVLWQWGFISITTTGLMVLGSVMLKALLSLLLLNLLTLTTSVPDLLQGLATLKMPMLLVAILASMYRYLAVLMEEFTAMRRAAISRNLLGTKRWERLVVGNMIGALFIRTYERGERVYLAMLSRGYQGIQPVQDTAPNTFAPNTSAQHKLTYAKLDLGALVLTVLFTLAGQALFWIALV